jgi:predicted permease
MDIQLRVLSSIGVLLILMFGVIAFKRFGLLRAEDGRIYSRLIANVTLPALILFSLAHAQVQWNHGELVALMVAVSCLCLGIGWLIANAYKLDGPGRAAVILATGFTSSSLLGFVLIAEVFPGNSDAMAEAVIVSGLGSQPLLFTVGTMIVQYYGARERDAGKRWRALSRYLRSPIFISLAVGLVLSLTVNLKGNPMIHSVIDGLKVVGAANTLMVLLAVGLILDFKGFKQVAGIAAWVGGINLILMPVLLSFGVHALDLQHWQQEVLVLQGAMPAATLSVVLCETYGGDAALAAKLVFSTTVAAAVTVPIVFLLAG